MREKRKKIFVSFRFLLLYTYIYFRELGEISNNKNLDFTNIIYKPHLFFVGCHRSNERSISKLKIEGNLTYYFLSLAIDRF